MRNVGKIPKKINLPCPVSYDEPMSRHTSFRLGGPADLYVSPQNSEQAARVFGLLNEMEVPMFILGAGANILVSDLGIRGAVIDLSALGGCSISRSGRTLESAWLFSTLCWGQRRMHGTLAEHASIGTGARQCKWTQSLSHCPDGASRQRPQRIGPRAGLRPHPRAREGLHWCGCSSRRTYARCTRA